LRKFATAILDDPPDAASFIAHVMLGQALPKDDEIIASPIVRMSPLIQPVNENGQWTYPEGINDKQFARLKELEMDAVKQEDVSLINLLGDCWIEDQVPNQPVRATAQLAARIGHDRFGSALRALEAWLRASSKTMDTVLAPDAAV
jgi:hypothetical protein